MLYSFFWVIPQRLNFMCRRLGTLHHFHLHRSCKQEEYMCVYIYIHTILLLYLQLTFKITTLSPNHVVKTKPGRLLSTLLITYISVFSMKV